MFGLLKFFFKWKLEICKAFKNKIFFKATILLKIRLNIKVNSLFSSIKVLKNTFIISAVDKVSNNFCIMCKIFYKKLFKDEYLGNNIKTKLTSPYSKIKNRLNAFAEKFKFHFFIFLLHLFHKIPLNLGS